MGSLKHLKILIRRTKLNKVQLSKLYFGFAIEKHSSPHIYDFVIKKTIPD